MRNRFRSSFVMLLMVVSACQAEVGDEASDTPTAQVEQAACTYPMSTTFGLADAFSLITPDPIPYGAPDYVFPDFSAYLNTIGVPTGARKTFDDLTSNKHMVATLRHGLRGCFAGATALQLCFRARAHADIPTNDSVTIYNTDFGVYSFPVVYSSAIAPPLTPTWTVGTSATLCINLTAQMTGGLIGDMLQFRVQDDTAVDVIKMTLF